MGYICHHALLVTSYAEHIRKAHTEAVRLAELHGIGDAIVSPISAALMNGTESFAIWPDGSKEGWALSDEGDTMRAAFVAWLEQQRYEDGSSPLRWVLVQYGDDNGDTRIVNDSDAAYRAEQETPHDR